MAKPKFSWDQFPTEEEAKKPKFNWDQFPEHEQKQPESLADTAQAAIEHFGNAAALGYAPQLQAMASKLLPNPSADVDEELRKKGFKIQQNDPTYVQDRDANIKRLQQQEVDHPIASGAGTIAGSIATGIATSGAAPINAASKIGRIAQAAKAGAVLGAVSNPGDKEGEISPLQVEDRLKNAATGAAVGGAGQGLVEGISSAAKAVSNIPNSLKNKAEERAFKASGAMLKDYRVAAGKDRVNEIGRYMLDKGLIKPGATVEEIEKAATKLAEDHGTSIGNILEKLDQQSEAGPSHAALADQIDAIAQPYKGLNTSKPTYGALQDLSTDIRTMGNVGSSSSELPGSFKGAQDVKQFISEQINKTGGWNTPNPSEKNLALREAYGKVNSIIEDAADKAANASGDQELIKKYLADKAGYRNALEVSKIAKDQGLRQKANNFFSLGDKISGSAGFAAGFASGDSMEDRIKKGLGGASIALASKAARTYGTPLVSKALDRAGSILEPLANAGKSAQPVISAIENSPVAAVNTARVLSSPRFDASEVNLLKNVATKEDPKASREPSQIKGEALWMQKGAENLGLDSGAIEKLSNSKEGKQLLIEASDLSPNSKRIQLIKKQISQGRGK